MQTKQEDSIALMAIRGFTYKLGAADYIEYVSGPVADNVVRHIRRAKVAVDNGSSVHGKIDGSDGQTLAATRYRTHDGGDCLCVGTFSTDEAASAWLCAVRTGADSSHTTPLAGTSSQDASTVSF